MYNWRNLTIYIIYIYIYINLPVNAIVRLLPPRSSDRQGQKMFLAPSADKQFSSGPIVWLPPNPKTKSHFGPNPNPRPKPGWGAIFLGGQLSRYQNFFTSIALLILLMKPLYVFRVTVKSYHKITVKSYHKMQELLVFLKILKLPILH